MSQSTLFSTLLSKRSLRSLAAAISQSAIWLSFSVYFPFSAYVSFDREHSPCRPKHIEVLLSCHSLGLYSESSFIYSPFVHPWRDGMERYLPASRVVSMIPISRVLIRNHSLLILHWLHSFPGLWRCYRHKVRWKVFLSPPPPLHPSRIVLLVSLTSSSILTLLTPLAARNFYVL